MYHVATHGDRANTNPVPSGTTAVSHSVLRRPNLAVMEEANGVSRTMPIYEAEAKSSVVAVSRPESLRRRRFQGRSMKIPTNSQKVEANSAKRPTRGGGRRSDMGLSVGAEPDLDAGYSSALQ